MIMRTMIAFFVIVSNICYAPAQLVSDRDVREAEVHLLKVIKKKYAQDLCRNLRLRQTTTSPRRYGFAPGKASHRRGREAKVVRKDIHDIQAKLNALGEVAQTSN